LQCWHRFRRGGQRYTTWLPQPRLPHPPLPGPHASCFSELLEGRRRGFPSPCSSPPWNCLELTQPIGRPGDPGEGPHSTKPKRRFQETFSQYASRIWPRVNKIQGPSLLAELEQETCPLRRSEPESHISNSPLSSNCRIGNTRHRSGSGATNYNWRKEKNGIFFVQCSTGSSGWDGEPGSGIKIEPCRRKSRGVGSARNCALPMRLPRRCLTRGRRRRPSLLGRNPHRSNSSARFWRTGPTRICCEYSISERLQPPPFSIQTLEKKVRSDLVGAIHSTKQTVTEIPIH